MTMAADEKLGGLGPPDAAPLLNRQFDPRAAELSPEDYFVLTRIDGRTSLRQLVLISGFPEARALQILGKLHERGAIFFPGDIPARPAFAPPPPPPRGAGGGAPDPAQAQAGLAHDPRLAEDVDLSLDQRRMILAKHASLGGATLFEVLGVGRGAEKRELKLAYRKLSKDFHPDRFFGKRLGSFHKMLDEIFEVASLALETLSDPEKREAYVASLAATGNPQTRALASPPPGAAPVPASRARAAELFEKACLHHVLGELEAALAGFADVVAADPQPRYLRRAAEAALKAQELRLAEEYAKKAAELDAHHAASYRVLGRILAASGRPTEARAALERALELDPANLHIAGELRDLEG
jgi:tetratricopeptide (TPR) repeat protein